MKRILTALLVGVVIGYGVQCEDTTGPMPSAAALPAGDYIAFFDEDLGIDNRGRLWNFHPDAGWSLSAVDNVPIPMDSVAHFSAGGLTIVGLDGGTWTPIGKEWFYRGKPEFP